MIDVTAMERVKEKLASAKMAMVFDFNGAPVYKYPNSKSEIIGCFDMYTKIYIYNEVGDFYFASCNFVFGYIPKSCAIKIVRGE